MYKLEIITHLHVHIKDKTNLVSCMRRKKASLYIIGHSIVKLILFEYILLHQTDD